VLGSSTSCQWTPKPAPLICQFRRVPSFDGEQQLFHVENARGEPFLRSGKLAPRPERFLYSPHYPKAASA
jgi:hypothetical protein